MLGPNPSLKRSANGRRHERFPPDSIPSMVKDESPMAKYLISFPSAAMVVPDGEWEAVVRDSHAVIEEAKASGVYVFGGDIDEDVAPALVSADGAVAEGEYPWAPCAQRRLHHPRASLTTGGRYVGRAHRESLPLQPRASHVRVRPAVLKRTPPRIGPEQ